MDKININNKNNITKDNKVLSSISKTKKYNTIFKKESLKYSNIEEFITAQTKYFHGTFTEFENFSLKKVGSNTGWDNSKFGIFFSDDVNYAKEFLDITKEGGSDNKGLIKEAYVTLNKPLDLTIQGIFNNEEQAPLLVKLTGLDGITDNKEALELLNDNIGLGEFPEFLESIYSDNKNKIEMEKQGYDGIISQFGQGENGELIKEYVVFNTEQIFTEKELIKLYNNK